ncbi:transcription factor BHLH42 [Triticum urartu]|uniref:BHLH domain-containing protein n=1 Tax=Triticum urartu TaxID=4572 RepID=A0A8R7NZD4_TRIUA|nr:transcription factor BHLH42 [Triticum urartu]
MASSGEVQRSLQAVAQGLRWTYALLWQLCPDQGALVWAEGHYNGAIKTRKTVQPAVAQAQVPAPAAEAADQARSRQLRELFDSLAREAAAGGGTGFRDVHGCAQEARRPSAALAPEDLTETEWFYLMSASYSFPPGVGLPGRAFARGGHVWLSRANEVDSKAFSRAILARSAGIKTVVCIPIVDGVLEIGTTEKVEEDMGLVQYAMAIFMDQQETHMISSICHSNQTSHIDQQSFQTQRKTPTGQPKLEPNKFNPEYEDDEMEYDDDEIDAECASGSASHDDHATHNAGSSELMQVETSERVRDGCSSNFGDEIQMLMVCQNSTDDHSNLHGQNEAWHFLYEELCSGYPQSSAAGENQAMAENAHYAQTLSLILHRNNALRQAGGLNTGSYLAVSLQSSFSRWDAGIHGRTVAQGTTRQKMLKSVLLFFSAACNKPPGDPRCDDAGARREVDFGASHVMQERKRREKLNERFIVLRSLVPFVTKMDKASILGDTIEYVKQLTKRIQDLESSTVRGPAMSKEKRALPTGMEGASSSSGSSGSTPVATDVQVSIIESDALLELRCPDRHGLLVTIMQTLQEQLRLEVTSVQASSDHGVLLAELRAKVREVQGRRSSISQVKRAIHLIISSG